MHAVYSNQNHIEKVFFVLNYYIQFIEDLQAEGTNSNNVHYAHFWLPTKLQTNKYYKGYMLISIKNINHTSHGIIFAV